MFWNMVSTNSTIEAVLDDPSVTLETILDQDEVIQECRATNKRLLEYLQRPAVMFEMLDLITREPPTEVDMAVQYKSANIACEVLTSDISFAEKICAEKSFMDKLFHFFRDSGSELNPVLASYVCRTLGEVVTRNLDQNWYSYQLNIIQIMGYLTSEPDVLQWILSHLGTNAVCDLLYKLIMNVEGQDMRNNLFEWMERERFLARLMEKMGGQETPETHVNVNKLVGDLLFAFRDDMSSGTQDRSNEADPFLVALKSPQTLAVLLEVIFKDFPEVCGSSVKNGLELTLALLGITKKPPKQRTRRNSFAEVNTDVKFDDQQRSILIPMLTKLDDLLKKSNLMSLTLTHGTVDEPIGPLRLAIANFIAQILSAHDSTLSEHIASLPIISTLMELFWSHPWNNFLHRQVAIAVTHLLNSRGPKAAERLVRFTRFVQETPPLFEDQKLKCGFRPYLATIATLWVQLQEESSSALEREMLDLSARHPEESGSWEKFCWTVLPDYDKKKKTLLGGVPKPNRGNPVVSSTVAQYDSDPGVDWDSNTFSASGQKSRFDSSDDFFSTDSTKISDDESTRNMFDLLCIKKSDLGDEDDILNSLEDATGDSINFGDFADFGDLPGYSENVDTDFSPELSDATPETTENQDPDPINIP
ncbi:unnamed protein product [Allacma fusca]|uniref:Uncharacterized protein n=1 Tax=Allacma fusca TaxID=39272 RepID=A0A8J2J7G3_9HEXA|nr:unnamed protein product [Allacma fusca]